MGFEPKKLKNPTHNNMGFVIDAISWLSAHDWITTNWYSSGGGGGMKVIYVPVTCLLLCSVYLTLIRTAYLFHDWITTNWYSSGGGGMKVIYVPVVRTKYCF